MSNAPHCRAGSIVEDSSRWPYERGVPSVDGAVVFGAVSRGINRGPEADSTATRKFLSTASRGILRPERRHRATNGAVSGDRRRLEGVGVAAAVGQRRAAQQLASSLLTGCSDLCRRPATVSDWRLVPIHRHRVASMRSMRRPPSFFLRLRRKRRRREKRKKRRTTCRPIRGGEENENGTRGEVKC